MKQHVKTNYVYEPFEMAKTTANNPNDNVQNNLPGRMGQRSKAPDLNKHLNRDFWYTNVCMGSNPTPDRFFQVW